MKRMVAEMSGRDASGEDVRVAVSPYRICPLGAHIDHQGGIVSAMTVNRGILLGFLPSNDAQVLLRSGQFKGEVKFSVNEAQYPRVGRKNQENNVKVQEEPEWGCYARGALYALQKGGHHITKGIIGYICGSEGLDSSGLSSSAAAGIAYLLAMEYANNITVFPEENIELDRLIENGYLGLRNGILDQSAILLSKYGHLTIMNCKLKEHTLVYSPSLHVERNQAYKILLAFSGLKHSLPSNPGYNCRVSECQEAAQVLLCALGSVKPNPILSDIDSSYYEAHKEKLQPNLARRAEHYFSENKRVVEGLQAWASGNLKEFGRLISASGLSSIQNYECGCEPMIQLYEILVKAPGVFGARFSGAGFRGCCVAFVDASQAEAASSFVEQEYHKVQPKLASQVEQGGRLVLICEAGDSSHVV